MTLYMHTPHTEITALRNKVSELDRILSKTSNQARTKVQHEYSELVDNLFAATMTVKTRYEDYRGHLYGDVTNSLYEVRQSVADNVTKMKEKLGLQGDGTVAMTTRSDSAKSDDVTMETSLKAEGLQDIQEENADLSKMVT